MQKSDRSRKGLETFERESRNTHGTNSEQLKKRPMFLDPPDDCRSITRTRIRTRRRKKKPFKKKKKITMLKSPSSSSSSSSGCSTTVTEPAANLSRRRRSAPYCHPPHREWCDAGTTSSPIMNFDGNSSSITYHEDGITTSSWKQMQEHQGRRRAMSPCPPVPPAPLQKVIDFQQDLESIDSSFDSEENDLLMLEPIELPSEDLPPELQQKGIRKRRLSHQQERHAHQQQPHACFGKIRSVDTSDCNIDNNYSAIRQHHHPPQQHQHFSVTMHHHHQFHNYPRYYPNVYPGNQNAGEFVDGSWCWY